jgi:hypothetical protein
VTRFISSNGVVGCKGLDIYDQVIAYISVLYDQAIAYFSVLYDQVNLRVRQDPFDIWKDWSKFFRQKQPVST